MDMQKVQFNFNIMGKRKLASLVSGLLIVISIISFSMQGLNFGIDFTGGTLVEVGYSDAVELKLIRQSLSNSEFNDAVVQYFGAANEVLIRIPPREGLNSADISNKILNILSATGMNAEMRRVEFVGPQVGEELKNDGGLAMSYALMGIFIYVAMRCQRGLLCGG